MAEQKRPQSRPSGRARMWVSDLRGGGPEAPSTADDAWVTGPAPSAQRVPGIDETPDAKYVDPATRPNRWPPVLIGIGVGLVVTALVGAIVVSSQSTDEPKADAGPTVTAVQPSSTTRPSVAANPVAPAPAPAPVPAPGGAPAAKPPTGGAPAAVAPPAPAPAPTPRATANPAQPLFVDRALPAGVSGTLTSCAWRPTNGGQYEAAGTITNSPSTNKPWTITIHWLQAQREIARQSAIVTLGAGQSKPWILTLHAPSPPADPFRCSLSAS